MLSVELVPDAAIEAAVRDDWARLESAGLPNAGRNPSPSNRPHVTLAVRDHLDPTALAALAGALPIPLEIGGVLLFLHARGAVVTRQVVPTEALLEFHRRIADAVGRPEARYASTAAGRWSPHITLARRVPTASLAAVLGAIEARPVLGEAAGLRVWDAAAKVITTLR